jgi:hypothetical protein
MDTWLLSNPLCVGHHFPGLQRLISVALADATFGYAILADPVQALQHLPSGVVLTSEECRLVSQVHGATTLTHFAAYLDVLMQDVLLDQENDR